MWKFSTQTHWENGKVYHFIEGDVSPLNGFDALSTPEEVDELLKNVKNARDTKLIASYGDYNGTMVHTSPNGVKLEDSECVCHLDYGTFIEFLTEWRKYLKRHSVTK